MLLIEMLYPPACNWLLHLTAFCTMSSWHEHILLLLTLQVIDQVVLSRTLLSFGLIFSYACGASQECAQATSNTSSPPSCRLE